MYGGGTVPRPTAVLLWQGIHLGALAVLALGVLIGLDDLVEAFRYGGFSDPLTVLRNQGIHEIVLVAALVALARVPDRTLMVAAAWWLTVVALVQGGAYAMPSTGRRSFFWSFEIADPFEALALRPLEWLMTPSASSAWAAPC
ncbi:hypothetical protein O7607_03475 [Micromonospora sp. WMMA1949]|uniref:hypothetical protein n=1 Tax=Micromonospora sp. WMMA1949 TaxID=3015162 RepID=UPI0022B5E894|nr:hypothetical protein [Micromonospora sp. WMMA1949]MCZ7424785.1 hypothetical protein [Micromonospora sp. WMMA1949]